MTEVLFVIAPLFVIIFAVAFLRRRGWIAEDWSVSFNHFALNIGLPAVVFLALAETPIAWRQEAAVVGGNALMICSVMVLSYWVARMLRLSARMRDTLIVCVMFSNVTYLGVPILTRVYGPDVLAQISIIVVVYLFGLFGVGLGFLTILHSRGRDLASLRAVARSLLLSPLLLAVVAGIAVNVTDIGIPGIITEVLRMIAAAVTPIVLIIIGVFIGQTRCGSVKEWGGVFLFTLVSLVGLPLIFLLGSMMLSASHGAHHLSILESAMPLGITPFALADKYNLDKTFIARAIVMGTAGAVVTLPMWIAIVGGA